MPVLQVAGLPIEVNDRTQMKILRAYLRKCDVEKYWINEISDVRGTDFKVAGLEVPTHNDAFMLESFLRKVPYRKAGIPYFLKAKIVNYDHNDYRSEEYRRSRSRSPQLYHRGGHRSCDRSYDRYTSRHSPERYRSRSPMYRDYGESSNLDLEIEYLRKKRQLIEEERRLITERKKLEMIKIMKQAERMPSNILNLSQEYGVSASIELENLERSRDREMRPIRTKIEPKREPKMVRQNTGVPTFMMPCQMIFRKMRSIINEAAGTKKSTSERNMFITMIRTKLRRRFAMALEGREYMPSSEIVKLYRELHPIEEDRNFVMETYEEFQLSFWPVRKKPENPKPKNPRGSRNINSGTKAAATAVKQEKVKPVTIKKEIVTEQSSHSVINQEVLSNVVVKQEPPGSDNVVGQVQSSDNVQVESNVNQATSSNDANEVNNDDGWGTGDVDEDDWATNGVDWDDDDAEDKAGMD